MNQQSEKKLIDKFWDHMPIGFLVLVLSFDFMEVAKIVPTFGDYLSCTCFFVTHILLGMTFQSYLHRKDRELEIQEITKARQLVEEANKRFNS